MRYADCHPDRKHDALGLCRPCYMADWYARHPGKRAEYESRWYHSNPEKRRAYYEANADRIKSYQRELRRANPDVNRKRIAAKYGLSLVEYDYLLSHPCAICGGVATDIDHDHTTGAVRAALCGPCNAGIGNLRDDPELAASAAAYLARHRPLLRIA